MNDRIKVEDRMSEPKNFTFLNPSMLNAGGQYLSVRTNPADATTRLSQYEFQLDAFDVEVTRKFVPGLFRRTHYGDGLLDDRDVPVLMHIESQGRLNDYSGTWVRCKVVDED